jgi:hypothetical protein
VALGGARVTRHAYPLSLVTFQAFPSAKPSAGKCQHVLQGGNVFANLCARQIHLFSRIIKMLTTLPLESKNIFINDFKA